MVETSKEAFDRLLAQAIDQVKVMEGDQRQILSWCASLEEAKLAGKFEHKPTDSYFLKQVKTICNMATMDIKEQR